MGWERKRGSLAEFNQLLLNTVGRHLISPRSETWSILAGYQLRDYAGCRYLATAWQRQPPRCDVGAFLSIKQYLRQDGALGCRGYTVLQPRVAIKPTSAKSFHLFSQILRECRL